MRLRLQVSHIWKRKVVKVKDNKSSTGTSSGKDEDEAERERGLRDVPASACMSELVTCELNCQLSPLPLVLRPREESLLPLSRGVKHGQTWRRPPRHRRGYGEAAVRW